VKPKHQFQRQPNQEKDGMQACQRFALAACCHANQLPKRGMFFERKKALKRNVATRQPARDVGKLLTFTAFAKLSENNLRHPTKLIATAELNKA